MLTARELALEAVRRNADALVAHAAAVRAGEDDIEHVHQARVATRRLRAALRVFRDVLPPDAEGLRAELKWIANQFAAVRDLDVQLGRLHAEAEELALAESLEPYAAWLRAERVRAMLPLCSTLEAPRFADLVRRLHATGDWQARNPNLSAGKRIQMAIKRLRKTAGNAHDPPAPAELHHIRIAAKRARYTLEFFNAQYGKPATALRERLVAIQDVLGAAQDTVIAREWIARAGSTWPAPTLLALGQLQHHEHQQAERARKRFEKLYRGAEKAWRRFEPSKLPMS